MERVFCIASCLLSLVGDSIQVILLCRATVIKLFLGCFEMKDAVHNTAYETESTKRA